MASTGVKTMINPVAADDKVVRAAVEAGAAVTFDLGEFCTVFVSSENARLLACLPDWEALAPPTTPVIGHYAPKGKKEVLAELRKALPGSPILNWE